MNLKIITFGCLWFAFAGCTKNPGTAIEVDNKVIKDRDAFYDGVRLGEDTVIVVGKFGKILRSKDSGKSWLRVPSGTDRPLLSVSFWDVTHGVIVGGGGLYLESEDGGLTWTSRSFGLDVNLFSVRFFSASSGFIAGEFGTLLRTETGGETWTRLELSWDHIFQELWETVGAIEPHLYDVAFCNSRYGWIVGEYGLILFSKDGGLTWEKQGGGGLFDRHLFTVACADLSHAIAAGQGGEMLYTADGGSHWNSAQSPLAHDIYDMVFLHGKGQVLALGDLGTVLVSASGGSPGSWKKFSGTFSDGSNSMHVHSWIAKGVLNPPDVLMVGQGVKRVPIEIFAGEKE